MQAGYPEQPAQQCKWPTCQSEEYQQVLAEQIKRELVGEQPSQQEPVAWQKRHPLRTEGLWKNTNEHDAKWWRDNAQGWEIRTLYTTPQPAQRKPLTYEEIQTIWRSSEHMNEAEVCRAIEAAHGIKEKS